MTEFKPGDVVEHHRHGGLGLVVEKDPSENNSFICVNWLIPPPTGGQWEYRDRHEGYDFLTSGVGLHKLGAIKI